VTSPLLPGGPILTGRRATADQVHAAARVLRRSCPPVEARGKLADLLVSFDTVLKTGAEVPPYVGYYFVEAVLSLAAVSAEEGPPAESGAGGPG
jgi:hypothetical protein